MRKLYVVLAVVALLLCAGQSQARCCGGRGRAVIHRLTHPLAGVRHNTCGAAGIGGGCGQSRPAATPVRSFIANRGGGGSCAGGSCAGGTCR